MRVKVLLLVISLSVACESIDVISADASLNKWGWIAGGSYESTYYGSYVNIPQAQYTDALNDAGRPAARDGHAGGVHDSIGLLYLFAGTFYASNGDYHFLNDLWVYNASSNQWGWLYGASVDDGTQRPTYTCQNVTVPCQLGPGSRTTDSFETSDGFVIYGQNGADSNGNILSE
jgi:hypothetical protein